MAIAGQFCKLPRKGDKVNTNKSQTFRAVIEDAGGGGAIVTIPFDVEQFFGKKRVKIKALIDNEPYRGSLVRMGSDCHLLLIRKDIRQKIGKGFGDEIEVMVEEDVEERVITLPPDMAQALAANPKAENAFKQLSYTHQREYVQWVEEAKRAETRHRRIGQTVERLEQGMSR